MDISFGIEQESMGTMGYFYHELENWIGMDDVFVTNGDELKEVNLDEMRALHGQLQAAVTIALVKVTNPRDYGVAVCDGYNITSFLEKPENPPSNYISSGLYILSPIRAFSEIHLTNRSLMFEKDLFPHLASRGNLIGYKSDSKWYDCGTLERWAQAIREW
jgi:NDP-sugar pyrophosphorylase family protein